MNQRDEEKVPPAWVPDADKIETILEHCSDAIIVLDSDWRCLFINAAAESLFRRQRKNLLGATHWENCPDLIGTPAQACLFAAAESRRPVNFEQFLPSLYAWQSVVAVPVEKHLILYCRDITDRVRLMRDEAVREKIRAVLENVPVAITITRGADHRIDIQNKWSRQIVGGRNVEGMLVRNALPETVEQGFIALLDQVYQSGSPFSGRELPLIYDRNGDGERQTGYFDLTYQPFFDTSGHVAGILHIGVDVTERLAERELISRLAAERDATLRQLSDGVIITDAAGKITFVNDMAREMHGVAALDVTVEDYAASYRLFTLDGRPYPSTELPLARAVLHDEFVINAPWKIQRPDGTMITVEGSAQPVFDEARQKIACVLVIRHCFGKS